MKIIKGFQNMGTEVKLLFKQLDSLSALCAISSISPPPISCAVNKICRVDYPCACGKCIPFRRHFVPVGFVPQPNQHYILPTLQAYTSAPHSLGKYSFHFASYIHSVFPKLFSNDYQWYIFFYAKSKPRKN